MEKRFKGLKDVGTSLDGLVDDFWSNGDGIWVDDYGSYTTRNESKYFESDRSPTRSVEDLEKLNVSHECLSTIYLSYLDEVSDLKSIKWREEDNKRKKRGMSDFLVGTEYWSGKSQLSKKLFLQKILEKDVGLDALPPSFVSGSLAYRTRREKINFAKLRIEKIMLPRTADDSSERDDHYLSSCVGGSDKQKKQQVDTDREDFVIETLLLHHVKEEEIEKGYYNALLDLHVFNSGSI